MGLYFKSISCSPLHGADCSADCSGSASAAAHMHKLNKAKPKQNQRDIAILLCMVTCLHIEYVFWNWMAVAYSTLDTHSALHCAQKPENEIEKGTVPLIMSWWSLIMSWWGGPGPGGGGPPHKRPQLDRWDLSVASRGFFDLFFLIFFDQPRLCYSLHKLTKTTDRCFSIT